MAAETIKNLLQAKRDAERAAGVAKEQLRIAVDAEMRASLPIGMKIVTVELEDEQHDQDVIDHFYAAVPSDYAGEEISLYRYHGKDQGHGAPAGMLVFDDCDYSDTWLQWTPWEEAHPQKGKYIPFGGEVSPL